jgi:hypothetical protein
MAGAGEISAAHPVGRIAEPDEVAVATGREVISVQAAPRSLENARIPNKKYRSG